MSERIDVRYTDVASHVYEILREFGEDFIYESCPIAGCSYVHQEETGEHEYGEPVTKDVPGCIVGQILHRMGVPLERLKEYGSLSRNMRRELEQFANVFITDRAYDYLNYAQYFQDRGVVESSQRFTWGQATQHANALVGRQSYYHDSEKRRPGHEDAFLD